MTIQDLIMDGISVQGDFVTYAYYDHDKDTLVTLTEEQAQNREIKYIYPAHGSDGTIGIMIEVEQEED